MKTLCYGHINSSGIHQQGVTKIFEGLKAGGRSKSEGIGNDGGDVLQAKKGDVLQAKKGTGDDTGTKNKMETEVGKNHQNETTAGGRGRER